jgi:hypothetical protein
MNAPVNIPAAKWAPQIAKALKVCNMKIEVSEVLQMVYNKELLFGESKNGKAFALLQPSWVAPGKLQIHIYCMGGDRKGMLELEHLICDYGRSVGALKITAITRKGFAASKWWNKNTEGWIHPTDFIEKEL